MQNKVAELCPRLEHPERFLREGGSFWRERTLAVHRTDTWLCVLESLLGILGPLWVANDLT